MHFFFGDDSRAQGRRDEMGRLVGFGGILVHEDALQPIEDRVSEQLTEVGVPPETEFKWSLPPENWIRNNLDGKEQEELRRKLLETTREAGASAIVVVIDTGRTWMGEERAAQECAKWAFERITTHLRGEPCALVADRPGGGRREEDAFLEQLWDYVREGTEFVNPDTVRHVDTSPSRVSRHLQLGDLVSGITTAMVAGHYLYAPPFFKNYVRPMLIENAMGYVGGTGLKLFPDELKNLYHWLLGENAYSKAKSGLGFRLPTSDYPYYENEGLEI